MPRDSQLLPAMSRALLRAARAGCIYIRPTGRAVEKEKEEGTDGEDQGATVHLADRSFTSLKWTALPKHLEPAEVEFLAKRRPGLSSLYGTEGGAIPGPMRKTKIKRTDPETGNISIYEVWVPEGHRIEGEITGDVQTIAEQSQVPVTAETPAPGTVVEGVGVVNAEGVVVAEAGSAAVMTPPKRRPPPPKRKGKGIGKGRKKKVMFAPGEGVDAAAVHGVAPADGAVAGAKEGEDLSQMSVDQSGQDEDEDDGEEGDESDEGDESMMDAKTPETPQAAPSTELAEQPSAETPAEQSKDVEMADALHDTQSLVSEPLAAGQEPVLQPTAAPAVHAEPSASLSASVTPTLPAEGIKAPIEPLDHSALERPANTELGNSTVQSTLEPIIKEEPQAHEPASEEKPVQETVDTTPADIKPKPTSQSAEEGIAAPVSASPEKAEQTPSEPSNQQEPEQPVREAPSQPIDEESAQPSVEEPASGNAPVSTSYITDSQQSPSAVSAPTEVKADVEMGEAPPAEDPTAAQLPIKEPSPSPTPPVEAQSEAKPESEPVTETAAPLVLETAGSEVSGPTVTEATPLSDAQPEEPLAPLPTPNPEAASSLEAEIAPASGPAPTEEPTPAAQAEGEEKMDKSESTPTPAPESS